MATESQSQKSSEKWLIPKGNLRNSLYMLHNIEFHERQRHEFYSQMWHGTIATKKNIR